MEQKSDATKQADAEDRTPDTQLRSTPAPRSTPYAAAYQGAAGAFSEDAALAVVGDAEGAATHLLGCEKFESVFDAVERGRARFGIVPAENTLAGSIHASYDLLRERDTTIVGEVVRHIQHALIALPGTTLGDVKRVMSHPVALAQCEGLFRRNPHFQAVPVFDTAGAVESLMRSGSRTDAAIASRRAAAVYGGEVLAEGIQDHPENFTRFVVIARPDAAEQPPAREEGRGYKTSLVFTVANRPGALYECLRPFAERGIDLHKLESRPLRGTVFEYAFYIDLAGSTHDVPVAEAIEALRAGTRSVRVLGSYPRYA
jgi:prephenate dehydratase